LTVFEGLEYSTSGVPAGLPETERRRGEGGWEVKAYLYVPDSLADWEIGYITAELHSGRFLRKDVSVTLVRTAESAAGVVSMGGISLVPDVLIGDVLFSEEDALLLPGAGVFRGSSVYCRTRRPGRAGDHRNRGGSSRVFPGAFLGDGRDETGHPGKLVSAP